MSIVAYVGLPRNGKSYGVVANQIMPALEQGRRVVTNIPLYRDEIRKITHKGEIVEFPIARVAQQPETIYEYATPGSVLIIDELWRLWPSGLKANQVPEPFKSILAEHGHKVDSQGRGMQIVFVTQDLAQIAAFARQLVETTFFHTKLSHLGADRQCRVDAFHGNPTGSVPPSKQPLRTVHLRFSKDVFKLYKSHTMSESATDGADEKNMDRRANIWRRPSIWVGAAGVVLAVVWGTSTLAGFATKYGGDEVSEANSLAAVPSSARTFSSPVSSVPAKPAPGTLTPRKSMPSYRLVGTVRNEQDAARSIAMISDGERTAILPLNRCRPDGPVDYVCSYNGAEVDVFGIR